MIRMSPQRWQEVGELYHAALQRPPEERRALLEAAPPDLRAEVESLLAQSQDGLLDRPFVPPAVSTVSDAPLTAGVCLGPYQIEKMLGSGGMGRVYKGIDTRLGRPVAVKVAYEEFGQRCEREARAISALNHPHICTLYDVGPKYLVTELVEGETLASRLRKGRLALADALRYGIEIADALAAAHAAGIVHRDLKPGNIMVTKGGIKVLDFGLAKLESDPTLTQSRPVMGTPAYMAPEQSAGQRCDERTDLYSLGLILCDMATGQRTVPVSGSLPYQLAPVIRRCLEADPEDRWQSAKDVKALLEWTRDQPARAPGSGRPTWAAVAAACLLATGAASGLLLSHPWARSGARSPGQAFFESSRGCEFPGYRRLSGWTSLGIHGGRCGRESATMGARHRRHCRRTAR